MASPLTRVAAGMSVGGVLVSSPPAASARATAKAAPVSSELSMSTAPVKGEDRTLKKERSLAEKADSFDRLVKQVCYTTFEWLTVIIDS